MTKLVQLTPIQKHDLENLWFVYGNHGKKHSHANHRFIQCLLEDGEDHRKFFKPDTECLKKVDEVLNAS